MVFSSLVFLCIFLPIVLILNRVLPTVRSRNILLLISSLIFYAYGEPVYVLLMIASCLLNYLWARLISAYPAKKKLILILSVIQNLSVLVVFKYTGFLVQSFNDLTGAGVPVPDIALPIGISFFTFQAMSYVMDVYRGEVPPQKNVLHVLLYVSFFPQLIAGPIVKYHDVDKELSDRSISLEETLKGLRRFIAGLGKKVLIANYMAAVADTLFAADPSHINILGAWLGAIAYMLQIYFDFSAYSDMAIGLGWMFGFHFKENFDYPYMATTIKDFWNRWHISLSGWFKQYLYIPLGGNRKGRGRTVLNKFIVFLATGIWHGANVTFLFWGIFHGFFLMLEEYIPFFRKKGGKAKKAVGHIYAILVVMIGFVFFRADNMSQGFFWIGQMFSGAHFEMASMQQVVSLLSPLNIFAFVIAIIGCAPVVQKLKTHKFWNTLSWIVTPVLLILCIMNLAGGTYNPFIYFRF